MNLILDGVGDWIKNLFGDSAELGVIVSYLYLRFDEFIKEHLSFKVYDGCSC
jgi:hypothetical protein